MHGGGRSRRPRIRGVDSDTGLFEYTDSRHDRFALDELARGLRAFREDLAAGTTDYTPRVTLVVQSEFGRRASENEDLGTDHGHGNNLLVLSGSANGGLHGAWPGLAPGALDDGDVAVTTDFRRVLSEILIRRLGNPNIDQFFPGNSGYATLGMVFRPDLPVGEVFSDGFEGGDLSAWGAIG